MLAIARCHLFSSFRGFAVKQFIAVLGVLCDRVDRCTYGLTLDNLVEMYHRLFVYDQCLRCVCTFMCSQHMLLNSVIGLSSSVLYVSR